MINYPPLYRYITCPKCGAFGLAWRGKDICVVCYRGEESEG